MSKRRKLHAYAAAAAANSAAPAPDGRMPYQASPGSRVLTPTPRGMMPPGGPEVQGYADFNAGPQSGAGPQGAGSGQAVSPMVRMAYPEIYDERGEIVNSPHMFLRNPNHRPPIDRGAPISSNDKAVRLGFQPQPRSLGFMTRGDAAMGDTIFRRTQIFAQLAPLGGNISETTFNNAIAIATQRTSDQRPRLWHVSVFGIGSVLSAAVPRGPLTSTQLINNGGFWPNFGSIAPAASTQPYVPQITTFKARAMIHDESGQRFFDFDVIGTRSFDVAAYAVTIFILLPSNGLELQQLNPNAAQSSGVPASFDGLLQDAIVGARVVPAPFEPLPRDIKQTQTISLSFAQAASRMPIPPGAKTVQLYSQGRLATDLLYSIDFDAASVIDTDPSAAVPLMGPIVIDPATFRSDVIDVPNASSITWRGQVGTTENSFIAVFTVDP